MGGPTSSAAGVERAVRAIAFYLPQFHPIAENDEWWGRGFTEWHNVARARPLFEGHYQPHVPAHLGFYDLRLAETRLAQARLAAAHGIEGFCYWHYWFEGQRLLERPFDEVLASGQPALPFCLAWANESWSRRWMGEERDILKAQTYSIQDDTIHARWLARAFGDRRYIRVDGRPLFAIYRPYDLPDPARTLDILRSECVRAGVGEPMVLGINAHSPHRDSKDAGFDGTINFEPQLGVFPDVRRDGLKVYDYPTGRDKMRELTSHADAYPCIFVSWDNTPRRGVDGVVFERATPEAFEVGLRQLVAEAEIRPHDDRLLFVNAWNEWAEGNHLEPDHKHGLAYLQAVDRATATTAPALASTGGET